MSGSRKRASLPDFLKRVSEVLGAYHETRRAALAGPAQLQSGALLSSAEDALNSLSEEVTDAWSTLPTVSESYRFQEAHPVVQ